LHNKLKQSKILLLLLAISLAMQFSSCHYAKHIPKEKTLLWQNRVLINGKYKAADKIDFINQLNFGVIQKPNTALFGLDLETANIGYRVPRVKLLNYNLIYNRLVNNKDSSFIKLIQFPVIYDSIATKNTCAKLKLICFNNGFFYATVTDSVVHRKKQKTCVYYNVIPGKNYFVNGVRYNVANKDIETILYKHKNETFLKHKEPLTLTRIDLERTRIATILVENGYYNFRPSAITCEADTGFKKLMDNFYNPFELFTITKDTNYGKVASSDVDFYISDSINNEKIKKYYIGKVSVEMQDFNGYVVSNQDVMYKNVLFKNLGNKIKPEIIYNNIFLREQDVFNTQHVDATINRLKTLNAFLNVKVDLKPIKDTTLVNCNIVITTNKDYDILYEIESTQGNNYALGSGLKIAVKNNNVFHRAYQLNVIGQFGVQANLRKDNIGPLLNLWQRNYGFSADLKIPHFLLPDYFNKNTKNKETQTNFVIGINNYLRPSAFAQLTANGQLAYSWKQNNRIRWKVTPAFLTFVVTPYKSDTTEKQIQTNVILGQQLLPYTILGSGVNMEYTNKQNKFQYNYTYLAMGIEKAGSVLNILKPNDNNIARYTKVETELKHYIFSVDKSCWANRIYIAAGIPIGKNTMPFIKQQNIGGQSSLRGWRVFELGPGPVLDSSNNNARLINNNGDIKIEMNTEYRIPVKKLFGGAFQLELAGFADAGNIWRYKDTSNNGIAQFGFRKIGKDLAVDAGLGVRLNFELFLIRLDYGIPVRQPYLAKNNGWVINQNSNLPWFRRNGVWQFGINYPF
jgi:outer membrane protein insertion porin family